jgi:Transposase IS116/IS110/IS902 family/Transposase
MEGGKTDRRDAFFSAERLRIGRLPAPFQVDVLYAPLQRLTRFRAHLAQTLAREKNYFLSFLFLKFSAFGTSEAFGDPFGATSLAVVERFSSEELIQMPLEDLAAFVQRQGRGRFADPDEVAATLSRAARDSYRLERVLDEPVTLVLGTTMATIRTLQAPLKEVDKTIARELAAIPAARRTIGSVPGLGPVWTAGLIAEIGAIHRFRDDDALAKYAGLLWPPHESGAFQADDTALSKAGHASLRYYLVEAANSVRLHCAAYRDFYNAKLAQSPKHAHKRAGPDGAQVGAPGRRVAAGQRCLPATGPEGGADHATRGPSAAAQAGAAGVERPLSVQVARRQPRVADRPAEVGYALLSKTPVSSHSTPPN